VFKVAYGVVRNAEDALDVVQETFLKAYRSLERFERRSSLLTWLCQIAIHRAIDMTRRKKVRKASELEEFMMGDGRSGGLATADPVGPRPELDPGLVAQGDELKSALDRALAKLSEKHREVFVLFTVKGLAYREIADALGIQIGTVMSRLFYARKHLQDMLREFEGTA
jgi:RNA polymerase sigma-70 factor (ECF subfamily)